MAHENIRLKQNNFCMGPQAGTICSIDTTNPSTILRIKSTTGASIIDLTLSSNILNTNTRVEYVGPPNLSSVREGLTFFTFEKVNNSTCIIKRWETRPSYRELLLKEQIVKSSTGNEKYNAIDFAVEYHYRKFSKSNPGLNYIDINDATNIKTGTKLFFGPSSDLDNVGEIETRTVSHITNYQGGKRIYLTAPLNYEYVQDDSIIFYSHVYIYSSEGYAGDSATGSLFKIDAYSWSTTEIDTKAIYKRVTASRWCPLVGGIASVIGPNMLFIRPYDSYLNWRSMFLNNVASDNNTIFPVYDIAFDNYSIYKLQNKTTLRDDVGLKTTYTWSDYNFQADSLLPYTQSLTTWTNQSILTGYNKNIDIYGQVRDQFNVGLRDVYVSFFKTGDTQALFDPLNGNVISDLNGAFSINYRSGSTYKGHTKITARATGGSSSTGSVYVWTSNNIISFPSFDAVNYKIWQRSIVYGYLYSLRQIRQTFYILSDGQWVPPFYRLKNYSYFTSPGGNWGPTRKLYSYEPNYGTFALVSEVAQYLPMLYRGGGHLDAPAKPTKGYGFHNWPWVYEPDEPLFIGNKIILNNDFEAKTNFKTLTNYLLYPDGGGSAETGYLPYVVIVQPNETGHGQISQLKLGLHTHWVDGQPYDELWTYVNVDQFVFVEEAIPKFWSSKNAIDTNIWLRLRPFAFSLDNNSLRMWIREESYLGDTGYYEITDQLSIVNFDAGGGMLGIEVTYNPAKDFLHESIIYVKLEVYDTAYIPNFIYVNYWFKVIPDYKSPYLDNLNPDYNAIDVPVDSEIYFEIKEEGTGINRNTLEVLLNSRMVNPDYLTVEEVSRYHYKVTYKPLENLYFSKDYKVNVKVEDTSPRKNAMNSSYEFRTIDSTGVQIIDPTPGPCKGGMPRFEDVSVIVLADGNGVDKDTIRMQVYNKDVFPRVVPIIYRIS